MKIYNVQGRFYTIDAVGCVWCYTYYFRIGNYWKVVAAVRPEFVHHFGVLVANNVEFK